MIAALLLALAALACGEPPPGPVTLLGGAARAERPAGASATERGQSVVLLLGEAPATAELAAALGGGLASRLVGLPARAREAVEDAELAAAVRAAGHVALAGDGPRAWLETLYPRNEPSALARALVEAHRNGAWIVARGDAAAFAAGSFVVAGPDELGERERNPRKREGPRRAWGLGLAPGVLVDLAGRSDGTWRRLHATAQEERAPLALFLAEASAVTFDRGDDGAERIVSSGAEPALVFDLRGARARRHGPHESRLARLTRGDAWLARGRRVVPADGARLLAVAAGAVAQRELAEPCAPTALGSLGEAPGAAGPARAPERLRLRSESFALELAFGEGAEVWRARDGALGFGNAALSVETELRSAAR